MSFGSAFRHISPLMAAVFGIALALACHPCAFAQASDGNGDAKGTTPEALAAGDAGSALEPIKPSASIAYAARMNGSWQVMRENGAQAGAPDKKKRFDGLTVDLDTDDETGSVQYQIHGLQTGWQPAAADGEDALLGGADSIDAVKIALTGRLSSWFDVVYRVYADGNWLDWKRNGAIAGSAGKGVQAKALQVMLVEKANAPSDDEGKGIIDVIYQTYVQSSGWTTAYANNKVAGKARKGLRLNNFKIWIDSGTYAGNVKYRVHRSNGKWTAWKLNGAPIGSRKDIEAIQIKLTGSLAKQYDIVYRTYVDTVGWQRRMRNGEVSGAVGSGLRLEAIKIALVQKDNRSGWVNDDGTWRFYKKGAQVETGWLDTAESPIDPLASGTRRYWIDAKGALALDRYVNPSRELDAKASYLAYATNAGYLQTGKRQGDEGITIARANGKLYTATRWLTTKRLDGSKQRYRLESNGLCSIVKTGLFKVGGKRYYGWEDGRGYLMRSVTWWVAGAWYKANASGALKSVDNQTTRHIERYVKWALRIARNDSHGYSQANRWGPDYDCSSLVVSALRAAGFPESGALWTGNMKSALKKVGFVWHKGTSGLRRGDIMLVHASYRQHTEIYLGNGKLVGAHIAETGTVYGAAGDQTGNEISIGAYYNAPWQGYLRYRS